MRSANAEKVDLLVVAHACAKDVNRRVYRELARRGWNIVVVTQKEGFEPESLAQRTCRFVPLEKLGSSTGSRHWDYAGLDAVLATVIPRLVLLDLEPDSVLAPKLATYSKTIGAKFHVQCCENIVPAVIPALTRGDARHAIRNSILIFRNMRVRRLVAGIIAISETVKECFDRRGYEGRTAVIPLAFDPGLFHNDERRRSSVRENMGVTQPLIAFFGRMVPEKGIHILLEALEKMIDLDWRFMCDDVVQSHEEFAASVKERLAKDPLRSRTRLIHPTHDEIAAFMNAADIVVVPSVSTPYFREQFGRVVSESMGSGCCVVVSDSGALPWVLGGSEYGVVFPEGDGEELARVLRQLIASPELREAFGRRAAARAQTEFTISRQADLLEEYWAKAGVVVALPSGASA